MTKQTVYILIFLLALLHQDFWFWHNTTMLFGFLPIGLAYHALYSLLAALVWYLAIVFAWPCETESLPKRVSKERTRE